MILDIYAAFEPLTADFRIRHSSDQLTYRDWGTSLTSFTGGDFLKLLYCLQDIRTVLSVGPEGAVSVFCVKVGY